MKFFRQTVALVASSLLVAVGLAGCSSELDPADFGSEILVGSSGAVIADEVFEVSAELLTPEGYSSPLLLILERRAVGEDWTTLAEQQISAPPYSFTAKDKVAPDSTAEYRLLASEGTDSGAFFIGLVQPVESLGEAEYFAKFFRPTLSVGLPDGVAQDLLVPGDNVTLTYGFAPVLSPVAVEVRLVSVNPDGSKSTLDSQTTSSTSAAFEYELSIAENIETVVPYQLVVEVARQGDDAEALVSSEISNLTSHSLTRYIENLFEALNYNCELDGVSCIESHEYWSGPFVQTSTEHWMSTTQEFFENNYRIGYVFVNGSIVETPSDKYDTPCVSDPVSLERSQTDRYFKFDATYGNGTKAGLRAHLYNDGSVIDLNVEPVMCQIY
jgi:hypothetical protein